MGMHVFHYTCVKWSLVTKPGGGQEGQFPLAMKAATISGYMIPWCSGIMSAEFWG